VNYAGSRTPPAPRVQSTAAGRASILGFRVVAVEATVLVAVDAEADARAWRNTCPRELLPIELGPSAEIPVAQLRIGVPITRACCDNRLNTVLKKRSIVSMLPSCRKPKPRT
jgi:hypothetical protein